MKVTSSMIWIGNDKPGASQIVCAKPHGAKPVCRIPPADARHRASPSKRSRPRTGLSSTPLCSRRRHKRCCCCDRRNPIVCLFDVTTASPAPTDQSFGRKVWAMATRIRRNPRNGFRPCTVRILSTSRTSFVRQTNSRSDPSVDATQMLQHLGFDRRAVAIIGLVGKVVFPELRKQSVASTRRQGGQMKERRMIEPNLLAGAWVADHCRAGLAGA